MINKTNFQNKTKKGILSMNYTVPTLSIACMAINVLAGIAIPSILFLVCRKKYRADVLPFFIGCAVFIVFALLVEGTINRFILSSSVGRSIQSNIWFYGIFGGLMSGLFEETGRYTVYKTVLKKKRGNDTNALMYGAGHGGFEAFYILIFSFVPYIIMAFKLNAGMADTITSGVTDQTALQTLNATFAALAGTPSAAFLMSIVERIAAVALQISLSVLVWFAAKDGGRRFWFYPLALILHAFVNAVAVIASRYVSNVWIDLLAVYIITACCVVLAAVVWKKYASAPHPSCDGAEEKV